MSKKHHIMIYTALGLVVVLAVGFAIGAGIRAEQHRAQLNAVYNSALLSILAQMEDTQLKLSKALLSEDSGQSAQLLSAVSGNAAGVQTSLSMLPLSHTAMQNTLKFANQLSDYSAALLKRTDEGLTDEDAKTIESLIATCEQVRQALYDAQASMAQNNLTFVSNDNVYLSSADTVNRPAEGAGDQNISYPTLIYDGPFSDARQTGTPKQLGSNLISAEDAINIAREFVGTTRVTAIAQSVDSGGVMPAYGVTVTAGDVTLQMAVTKTGGKVLWMFPEHASFEQIKSMEECRDAALQFLSERGYANMHSTYFQVYDGVAVFNFAATQGSVVLYPDLVKVQLRMDTAQVVGLEANHYLMNHTARGSLTPTVTLEEAEGAVSKRLTIDLTQLCVIPINQQEALCYEFRGTYAGNTYLVYIDATTGKQVEILKIIEDNTGVLTA